MMYGTMSYVFSSRGVLMVKKIERKDDPNSGRYTLPGGKLEDFEKGINPRGRLESAIRETEAETGIKLDSMNSYLRGTILFDNKDRIFDNWDNPCDYLVYIYSSKALSEKLKETEEGIPEWVPEWKIDSLPKNSGDKRMYGWLNDGRNFMGVIKHKGKELDESGTWVDWLNDGCPGYMV